MRAETARLVIRDWNPDADAEQAFAIYGDAEVMKYLGVPPRVETDVASQRESLLKVLNKYGELDDGTGFWPLERKEDGRIVGGIVVKQLPDGDGNPTGEYEVGWHLGRDFWGSGYATEAAEWGLDYLFGSFEVDVAHALAYAENERSIRVMQRLGMKSKGTTQRFYGIELVHYTINRGDRLSA